MDTDAASNGIEGKLEKSNFDNLCPECNKNTLVKDFERGEIACDNCGIVTAENLIDHGPPHRDFSGDQKDSLRHHGPAETITRHDKGLPVGVGFGFRDAYGKPVPASKRGDIYRMRKQQNRANTINRERSLSVGLIKIAEFCSRGNFLKDVHESAAWIYKRAFEKNLIRGRSIDAVAAASIYGSCRQQGVARTLDEIGVLTGIDRKYIGRTYRYMSWELKLCLLPAESEIYIPRICTMLGLSQAVQTETIKIIQCVREKIVTSGGSLGIATGALYIASVLCNEARTQREIALAANVTEVTIRNRYKEIILALGIDLRQPKL